jgi:hypothetical protein
MARTFRFRREGPEGPRRSGTCERWVKARPGDGFLEQGWREKGAVAATVRGIERVRSNHLLISQYRDGDGRLKGR